MPLNVIIVEDDPRDASHLISILNDYSDLVHIQAVCEDYDSARCNVLMHRPHLVFVDILLAGREDGHLLTQWLQGMNIFIAYVTSDAQKGAVKALNIGAHYYIGKPAKPAEVFEALLKAGKYFGELEPSARDKKDIIMLAFVKGQMLPVDLKTIIAFEAANTDAVLHSTDTQIHNKKINSSLKDLEDRLKPHPNFVKVHKSYIVNVRFIVAVEENYNKLIFPNKFVVRANDTARTYLRQLYSNTGKFHS